MSSTGGVGRCPYCGGYHTGTCPMIEEIEYYPNGTVKKVKLRPQVVDLRERKVKMAPDPWMDTTAMWP